MRLIQLPGDQADQSENQRNEDSEIEEPESKERHSKFAFVLGPAGVEFED